MTGFGRSFVLLLRWQAGRLLTLIPLLLIVQILLSAGLILGLGQLLSADDVQARLFLSTGAPTVTLITVGLVVVPLQVSASKAEGSIEFMWSLPVPRLAFLLADLTLWLLVAIPGLALSLLLSWARYDVPIHLSAGLVPVVVLVALTATSIGYALAACLPAMLAQLASQALVFGVLMFSPINYPASRLPDWAAAVHAVLPFEAMGDVVRHALVPGLFAAGPSSYLLLASYCVAGLLGTHLVMSRRR